MSDWLTHLGTTYFATYATLKTYPKIEQWVTIRHILIGALLPDVTRFTIILVDVWDWPAIPTFTYLIPFHSLLIISLLAGGLALLIPGQGGTSKLAFAWIMAGALGHFVLDEFEGQVGCGSTFLYPLYGQKLFSGWSPAGPFALVLLGIAVLGVALAFRHRPQWERLTIRATSRRLGAAGLLLLLALIIPLLFQNWLITQNVYYLGFATQPAAYEQQTVELCYSEVIATNPTMIEEFDTSFVLASTEQLKLGEWVTVRGEYQDGRIYPSQLIHHRSFSDVYISLFGLAAFLGLMFDRQHWFAVKRWFREQNRR